jgi:putative ABC transport system substrate-binding protein
MDRRTFLATLTAPVVAPFAAEAQQAGRTYRVGVVCGAVCDGASRSIEGLPRGLSERGWIEGRTVTIHSDGQYERVPELVADLIKAHVDVIVAASAAVAVPAARASTTAPVVFYGVADPVSAGIVQSLARPGGHVTGLTYTASDEYWGKLVEVLKEAVPAVERVGLLWDVPDQRPTWWATLERAGVALGVSIMPPVSVRGPETFRDAIARLKEQRVRGVIVTTASTTYVHRAAVAEHLLHAGLPSVGLARELPEAGGFLSYGTNLNAVFIRVADYVDRILRGAKPADLPVEQPTTLELVINLKTAKALGLTIPSLLLLRADQVIDLMSLAECANEHVGTPARRGAGS